MPTLLLIRDLKNFLQLDFRERVHPDSSSSWDGNWLRVGVVLRANGLRRSFIGLMQAQDVERFRDELAAHERYPDEIIALKTLNGCVSIEIERVEEATCRAECCVCDPPDVGTVTTLTFEFPPGRLWGIRQQMELAVMAFPVVTSRTGLSGRGRINPN